MSSKRTVTDTLVPRQHAADDTDIAQMSEQILRLIRTSFAYMESRIDPPSSMHRLSTADIIKQCRTGEVWSMNNPVSACMFLKLKPNVLYVGRLAVSSELRHRGISRTLIGIAEQRAHFYNREALEIETRVELTENHQAFKRLGFKKKADGTHPGYTQPTYIVMHKNLITDC